ncbi:MAG: hypothetical protein AB4372_09905 [Xenococcus sp. (in: cyanobacteria)]
MDSSLLGGDSVAIALCISTPLIAGGAPYSYQKIAASGQTATRGGRDVGGCLRHFSRPFRKHSAYRQ